MCLPELALESWEDIFRPALGLKQTLAHSLNPTRPISRRCRSIRANPHGVSTVAANPIVHASPIAVMGTGSALPANRLSTAALLAAISPYLSDSTQRLAVRLVKKLGIEGRNFSRALVRPIEAPADGDTAPRLLAIAMRAALRAAQLDVSNLGMLIGHTTTPHTLLPSNVAWVAEELEFHGPHLELRQACTGFAAAAVCSAALIDSGAAPIAVAGSEVGSVMLDLHRLGGDSAQLVNCLQMGDGAGAIILGAVQHERQSQLQCVFYGSLNASHAPAISLPHGGSGSPALPCGAVPHFHHDYAAVRRRGAELLKAGLAASMAAGIDKHSIDWWMPQQVNGRMPEFCAQAFDLPAERVICEASTLGNLGSAAMWVALDRVRRSERLRPGDRVLAFGAEASKFMYGGFLYVHGYDAPMPREAA